MAGLLPAFYLNAGVAGDVSICTDACQAEALVQVSYCAVHCSVQLHPSSSSQRALSFTAGNVSQVHPCQL